MLVDFQRTLRSVSQEQRQTRVGFILFCAMLVMGAGWGAWLFMAQVDLYELSASARIEIGQSGRPVDTVLSGRVSRVRAVLGQAVKMGDILVELDSTAVDGQIEGAKIELAALATQLESRRAQAKLTEQLVDEKQSQGQLALDQTMTRREQAEGAWKHAEFLANQRQELLKKGAGTNNDYISARHEADGRQDELKSARLEINRTRLQTTLDLQEIRMRLADLRDHTAELEASIARKTADLESLRQQREDRKVRAPSDGVIGELAEIRPGSVVQVGARLATILPDGTFHVVARFVPAAAIGRVLPGQTARVRLNGFPSEQYGRLTATVADIAGEVRDGTIKVDLALTVDTHSAIPLQHGQPGEVEINVGRSSPLDLIIRSAGHMIHSDPAKAEIKTALNGSNS